MKATPLGAVVPLLLAAACAMPPKDVDDAAIARFDNAVLSMGCQLITEPHFLATELQTGLTREQVIGMIEYNVALDRAVPMEDGGHQFMLEGCA